MEVTHYFAIRFKKSGDWLNLRKSKKGLVGEPTPIWVLRYPFPSRRHARDARKLLKLSKKDWRVHGEPVLVKVVRYVRPSVPKFQPWADHMKIATEVFEASGIRHRVHLGGLTDSIGFDITDRNIVGMNGVPERVHVQVNVGSIVSGGVHLYPSHEVAFAPEISYVRGSPEAVRQLCQDIVGYLQAQPTPAGATVPA